MNRTMIKVEDLWEQFRIREERPRTAKEAVTRLKFFSPLKAFWALREVSLNIAPGETVGLIGENGSGKSTLLRCIAGILPPTRGEVLVGGTIGSLIELGVDFHVELTGRENVMVNGALFGLSRKQLLQRFDSIVAFGELEDAIDRPVRAYSSGMRLRLAFSLSVHVEPDILLIDEALAVGDENFQRKCIQRVGELGNQGVTIVFVTHDMHLLKQLCRRTILMHHGRVVEDSETAQVVETYMNLEDRHEQEIAKRR